MHSRGLRTSWHPNVTNTSRGSSGLLSALVHAARSQPLGLDLGAGLCCTGDLRGPDQDMEAGTG